jgi:serine/threonine-protein kinase
MREPAPGDQLDQYQLSQLIARSGMASIFKAIDTETGQTVAVKIPHMQFESDVVFYERFRREEEIGQKLDHPNLTKVLRPKNKSRMYVVMEFVEGKSLRQILQEEGKLPQARALAIARQICEAIAYLHEQGVVHRDLKPENIVLTPAGSIKILDFGIALDQSARRLTWYKLSATVGTPDYIAPGQVAGKRGDARTDVYAVGTMLYDMLTGHLPFTADNPLALMAAKTRRIPGCPPTTSPRSTRRWKESSCARSNALRATGKRPRRNCSRSCAIPPRSRPGLLALPGGAPPRRYAACSSDSPRSPSWRRSPRSSG